MFNKGCSSRQIFFGFPSFPSLNLAAGMLAVVLFFSNRCRVLSRGRALQVGEFVTIDLGDVPTEMGRMHRHESCAIELKLRWFCTGRYERELIQLFNAVAQVLSHLFFSLGPGLSHCINYGRSL